MSRVNVRNGQRTTSKLIDWQTYVSQNYQINPSPRTNGKSLYDCSGFVTSSLKSSLDLDIKVTFK